MKNSIVNSITVSRINNLDALKGIAVIFMIFQHLTVWLWNAPSDTVINLFKNHPIIMALNTTGGISAAIFIVLSGIGYCNFTARHGSDIHLIKRGIFLIISGYILNIIVPSWYTIGSWYVLHMIGFSILFTFILIRFKSSALLLTGFIILIITSLGQDILNTPFFIYNQRMGDYHMPGGILRLMFFEGHFPVFPWLAVFITGVVAGRLILKQDVIRLAFLSVLFLFFGTVISLIYVLNLYPSDISIIKRLLFLKGGFYPANPPLIILLCGGVLLFVTIAVVVTQLKETNPLATLGRNSLTVFIVHIVIFREIFIRLGLHQKFTEFVSILIMFGAVTLFSLISYFWSKKKFIFSLEWFMRII